MEILIENVVKKFNDRTVLENLSFKISQELFAFLGPNGAGKTTLINILCGLLKRDSGKVIINGFDPNEDINEIRKLIGLVPQETALYEYLTAKENLEFHAKFYGVPRTLRKTRIQEALELAQLEDRQNDRVSSYSGGMKRRLALVRSLIHEPSILILDEPTLGVDVQSRNEIWNRINELKKERIVILSTNYMDEANKLADRCAIIDQGKLIALDTTENLKINYAGGTILEASLELTTESLEKLNDVYSNLKVLKSDGRRSSITITENIEANQLLTKFSQTIQNFKDISVINLNVRVPTLDDVFLELTGTSLRD